MRRFVILLLGLGLLAPALLAPSLRADEPDADRAAESIAATVITYEPPAEFLVDGHFQTLALGQMLGPGDTVRTGERGGAHLVLADGSSVVLGPNTEVTLKDLGPGDPGSNTIIQLMRGVVDAIVHKLTLGAIFEIHTPNAVAAVKGTDFEVDAGPDDTAVTVNNGTVELGDPARKRFAPVLPLHRRRLMMGRLLEAEALPRREIINFRQRWERAHMFHDQARELLKHFRVEDRAQRARFRHELLARRAWREAHGSRRVKKRILKRHLRRHKRWERRERRR